MQQKPARASGLLASTLESATRFLYWGLGAYLGFWTGVASAALHYPRDFTNGVCRVWVGVFRVGKRGGGLVSTWVCGRVWPAPRCTAYPHDFTNGLWWGFPYAHVRRRRLQGMHAFTCCSRR